MFLWAVAVGLCVVFVQMWWPFGGGDGWADVVVYLSPCRSIWMIFRSFAAVGIYLDSSKCFVNIGET